VVLGILICLGNDPSGSIRNTLGAANDKTWEKRGQRREKAYEVKNLSLEDECVKGRYDLLDGGAIIPPVHVEDVDIRGTELLEGFFHGQMEGFGIVPRIINLVRDVVLTSFVAGRILGVVSASAIRIIKEAW
jgi:hypothetical protein